MDLDTYVLSLFLVFYKDSVNDFRSLRSFGQLLNVRGRYDNLSHLSPGLHNWRQLCDASDAFAVHGKCRYLFGR